MDKISLVSTSDVSGIGIGRTSQSSGNRNNVSEK